MYMYVATKQSKGLELPGMAINRVIKKQTNEKISCMVLWVATNAFYTAMPLWHVVRDYRLSAFCYSYKHTVTASSYVHSQLI